LPCERFKLTRQPAKCWWKLPDLPVTACIFNAFGKSLGIEGSAHCQELSPTTATHLSLSVTHGQAAFRPGEKLLPCSGRAGLTGGTMAVGF